METSDSLHDWSSLTRLVGVLEFPHDVVPYGEPGVVSEGGGGARGEDGGGGHQLAEGQGVGGEVAAVGGLARPQQAAEVAVHLLAEGEGRATPHKWGNTIELPPSTLF